MDSRFIKSGDINQKLRNRLFQSYYKNVKLLDNKNLKDLSENSLSEWIHSLSEGELTKDDFITYYQKFFNPLKDPFVIIGICTKRFATTDEELEIYKNNAIIIDSEISFLLPDEINRFCMEFDFYREEIQDEDVIYVKKIDALN